VSFKKFLPKAKIPGFAARVDFEAFSWDLLDPAQRTAVSKQLDRRIKDFKAAKAAVLLLHRP